ncbi:MAG: flagellin lysine-N-methylase [Deltaproteobacteria bacterium]|nr:flagellin lysine-N-methylase [Deltaproteobacteria bacterium]
MATFTKTALVPRFASRFQCIGDRCEDTCCSGWTVTVDRATYERYQRLPASPLRDELLVSLKLPEPGAPAPAGAFSWFAPRPGTRDCPMLGGGLCRLQQRHGEEALSDTCASYPRTTRSLGSTLSQGLTLSCPEAARLALLSPDAFEFVAAEVATRPSTLSAVPLPAGLDAEAANAVRLFCLQVMGSDGAPLWARLAVLGLFCEQLTPLLRTPERVPGFLASFGHALSTPGFLDSLEAVPAKHAEQAHVFAPLLARKVGRTSTPHQRRVEEAVATGLGATETSAEVNLAQLAAAYSRGVTRLPEALESAAPKLLEHFVLNELFRESFPFDGRTPQAHFVDLVIRFGILRLMLAARCVGDPLPDATALVETTQVFCRRFQHDPAFAQEAREAFQARGWDSMARLFGYLRS